MNRDPLSHPDAITLRFTVRPQSHALRPLLSALWRESPWSEMPSLTTHFPRHLMMEPKVDSEGWTRGLRWSARVIFWPWPERDDNEGEEPTGDVDR